jgi:O-antigen/teichoic acid export membrane protein
LMAVSTFVVAVALLLSFDVVELSLFGGRWSAVLIALLASLLAVSEFYSGLLRSLGRTAWALVPRDVVWRAAAPVSAIIVMWQFNHLDAASAMGLCVVTLAILTVMQAIISARSVSTAASSRIDWSRWKSPLMFMAASSILFAMVQQLDVVVVGALVGPVEAGAYFAAQKSASLLGLVMIAGGMVAAPLMSSAFQAGDRAGLQKLCTLLSIAITSTTLIGFLCLILFGALLLNLFDPDYVSAYPVLVVLALGFAFDALAGPTAYLMQMTKLERHYLKLMAASYALVLALQLILVPIYGPIAAAAATTFGYLVWNGTAIYLVRKHIGVDSSILSTFLAPKQPRP